MPIAKTDCPHCGAPFYPQWEAADLKTASPDRTQGTLVGRTWTTTCTSCDKVIIEFGAVVDNVPAEEWDSQQVFPVPPETVIEIIIKVFIDLENIRRRQEGAPKMTDDEEDAQRTSLRGFFKDAWETVKTGGDAVQVIGKYLPFFQTLLAQLPPPS